MDIWLNKFSTTNTGKIFLFFVCLLLFLQCFVIFVADIFSHSWLNLFQHIVSGTGLTGSVLAVQLSVYTNATDFCALILYHFIKLFYEWRVSQWNILVPLYKESPANWDNLTCPFPIGISLVSFYCLMILARTSRTIEIVMMKIDILASSEYCWKCFQLSPFSMMLSGFLIYCLDCV